MNFKTSDDDLIKVTNLEARMRGTTPVIMSFTPKSTNLEIKNISFEKELNKIKKTLDFSDNSSAKQEDDWENSISTLPYETKNYEIQRNYEENFWKCFTILGIKKIEYSILILLSQTNHL